jgi:hypothetical protein
MNLSKAHAQLHTVVKPEACEVELKASLVAQSSYFVLRTRFCPRSQ